MSIEISQGELDTTFVTNRAASTLDLSKLLGTQAHVSSAGLDYFRGSAALSRAVMVNLLAHMANVPAHAIDSAGVDRAFVAYRAMGSLPHLGERVGSAAIRDVAALLRGSAVSEISLAHIFGVSESARSDVRLKLEVARAVGVLPTVVAVWLIAAAHEEHAELAAILKALAAPRYS